MKRPSLWSLLFHRQPIEEGVRDPIEEQLADARRRVREAAASLSGAVNEMLATMDRYEEHHRTDREDRTP